MNNEPLTEQELQVLKMFASRTTRKKACEILGITDYRYAQIRKNILKKLGGRNLLGCMSIAFIKKIIFPKDYVH